MSQLDSGPVDPPRGVIVQKPKTNIYTIMLLLSLIGMITACVFLYLELEEYGGFGAA